MKWIALMSLALLASCVEVGENGASGSSKSSSSKRKCYYNNKKVSCKLFDRFAKNKKGQPLTQCGWTKAESLFEGLNDLEKGTRKKGYALELAINVCDNEIKAEFELAKITSEDITHFEPEDIQDILTEVEDTIDDLAAEYVYYQNLVWGSQADAQKLENLILDAKLSHLYKIQEQIAEDEALLPEINVNSIDQYTIPQNMVR